MNTFFSKENLLFVNGVFTEYLEETFGVNLAKIEDPSLTRKIMFSFMTDVNEETKDKSVKTEEKNIMLLGKAKQHYMKQLQLTEKNEKRPNIQHLSRDKEIFGNRHVVVSEKRPLADPYSKRSTVNDTMERVMIDRYKATRDEEVGLVKKIPDARIMSPLDKDQPEAQDVFNQRIKELELERSNPPMATMEVLDQKMLDQRMFVEKERNEANALENHDPKAMFRMATPVATNGGGANATTDDFLNDRREILIPRVTSQKSISKYLSINSFDRNWTMDPYRYKYVVSFQNKDNDIMSKYRNIESLGVSKVIIPEEVIPANSVINQTKTAFNYDFSFSYPYLLLSIDEFTDIYDGTNQHARKAFATLVYHRHYKAPNGRGFIILKPIQEEKKYFYPNLLSTLPKMSISLTKPDGTLLNTSADNYKVFKIEYEIFNPQYIKIVTDVFFDRNEFYIGDMVNFAGFNLAISPMTQDARDFTFYINRAEGHEVKQIGCANDNGYFKTFYIEAPGSFNKVEGRYVVAMNQINTLNDYNDGINWSTQTAMNGSIMNMSLQNTICMNLCTSVDDARVIHQQIL